MAPGVIEGEVIRQACTGVFPAVIGFQIDLLVFHPASEPLDEDVVHPTPAAVHADGDLVVFERTGE